jgi:hypothetical protein
MGASTAGPLGLKVPSDTWAWWQARRLRYNLALATAGWAAYGLFVALFYLFGRPVWQDWQGALSMTLFLGVAFLVLMGVANVCYVLGPITEAVVNPSDAERYRRTAYAMGFWASVALPFAFPAINLALLLGQSAG